MMRTAAVAGQFYPASDDKLREMIRGLVDETAEKLDVIGAVCPHAGYAYSGQVAGAVYSRIKFKDTFILIGPNHTGRGQPFSLMSGGTWSTPLGEVPVDARLAEQILGTSRFLRDDTLAHQAEHSLEVQLPFLQYFRPEIEIVPVVLGYAGSEVYKEIGRDIVRALAKTGREAVIIASSDMTHYEPRDAAKSKDDQAISAILDLDADRLVRRVEELKITMCGYAPAVSLITAARLMGAQRAELVGYRTSGDATGDYSSVVGYAGIIVRSPATHPLVRLARQAVETYVREGKFIKPDELTPEMRERAGVFVSIHEPGSLRGCIGTFEAMRANVAEEVIINAISSATRDPRFTPVQPRELDRLTYSVDVLTEPEPVSDTSHLDVKKYGLILEAGWRRGLLLPDLEGVDSLDSQINICRQKAGIGPNEPVKLYRFEVRRYR
ncbi:MAG: MEMO1 family protein [Chloroflexi bacterium]|nr:MEMO1 family protein [Chloroflexota bacterium]